MMIRRRRGRGAHFSKTIGRRRTDRVFLTIAPEALRLFSNPPDSLRRTMRSRTSSVATAFPDGSNTVADIPAKAEHPFMLPGFRFLFAAIVLSMSMLIFGLGAAALLRAAHEEFASIPSRRGPPETIFAQRSDPKQALAVLRVEPSGADQAAAQLATSDNAQDQPAIVATPPEPDEPAGIAMIAALTDAATPAENSARYETPKSELATPEIPAPAEASARTDVPPVETKVTATAGRTPTEPDHATAPVEDSTRIAETKIATLGGPPVAIETPTPSKLAPAVVKKSAQIRRVIKRRRIAQRARVARPAPRQPANPFGAPFGS
jgi:hypothetical protein